MITYKKTITIVKTTTTQLANGESVTTTETTTSSSDGDPEDFEEIEKAIHESTDAMSRVGDQISRSISESIRAITDPIDRLFRRRE
jgi:hypothetical protein